MILDKDQIAINNDKHVLFHLSKYAAKLDGNIVHKIEIEMSSFIEVSASPVFAAISEFWFTGFCRLAI